MKELLKSVEIDLSKSVKPVFKPIDKVVSGQNDEYLREIHRTNTKIFSKNESLVATNSPFNPDQVIIMGLKFPVLGVIVAQIVPDPTYPEHGTQPYGVFFPPNDSIQKNLISFEGIRKAFGLTISQIYHKLSNLAN